MSILWADLGRHLQRPIMSVCHGNGIEMEAKTLGTQNGVQTMQNLVEEIQRIVFDGTIIFYLYKNTYHLETRWSKCNHRLTHA